MKQVINVCCVNFWAVYGEKELNRKRILEFIEAAKKRGADMVLFPEMALTGHEYREDNKKSLPELAESVQGETVTAVSRMTKELSVYAAFGMPERDENNQYYQTTVVCGPEGYVGASRKMFLEGREVLWAKNGNHFFEFETPWGRVGVGAGTRAEDEELVLSNMSDEVRLVLFPSATQNKTKLLEKRLDTAKGLVRGGGVFVAFSNLAGKEMIDVHKGGSANVLGDLRAMIYGGGSFIAGPSMHSEYEIFGGGIDRNEVGMQFASIDLSHAKIAFNPELIAEMRCSYV